MKILYLITKSNWGGAQRYVYDLATNLPQDSYEVVVALGGTGERKAHTGVLEQKLHDHKIRTVHIRNFMRDMSPLRDVHAFFEVLALLRHERPDVMHANSSKAGGVGMVAGFLTGIPVRIFTVHGFAFHESRSLIAILLIRFASWCTLLFATRAICVSKLDADIARKWLLVGQKIRYVPIGIQAPDFLDRKTAQHALAPELPGHVTWLGTIAELHPNKGLVYAIQACALLRDRGMKFAYVIVGSGQEKESLQKLIHQHDLSQYVFLAGYQQDAAKYVQAFDIFLLPSIKEGLPYVALEAGVAGVPVVASAIPALQAIFAHEQTALLFSPKNPKECADALQTLLEDTKMREKLGKNLHDYIASGFALSAMIEKTVALYS